MTRLHLLAVIALALVAEHSQRATAAETTIAIDAPMSPPNWALLERQLLEANAAACEEYFARYFDERGYLLCVERWGGNDGPDDAIENCNDWPILHLLGAPDVVRQLYERAWEGHLRQYTAAKTKDVPMARDGMYYKEFPVMFDWMHNGEGLAVFNLTGLCNPHDNLFQQRTRRYAGFYMNEDPGAPNYDPQHKIIRSMFNGSRGPLMRKATALDWAGDPVEVENRFLPGHGERTYEEMLAHFKDYTDTVGDHPQNLRATTLAFNAYALSHEEKYKRWALEYIDAWVERAKVNGGVFPSNVGLDGKIGSSAGGKWYGGVYGWGFSVIVPQTGEIAHRTRTMSAFAGLMNAWMFTSDNKYLDAWRAQLDAINAQSRVIDGKTMYPRMYGDNGWYAWTEAPYAEHALDMYCLSMKEDDLRRVPKNLWLEYLQGKRPDYPESALRRDLAEVRKRTLAMRDDPTTPDTRLADDPYRYNPASVDALLHLTAGGIHPGRGGNILCARLRYFDPFRRRAGLPDDVAALVTKLTDDETEVTLVNVNQLADRTVIVQAGAYGEHQFQAIVRQDSKTETNTTHLRVKLGPGAGEKLTLKMKRHVNPVTFDFPID